MKVFVEDIKNTSMNICIAKILILYGACLVPFLNRVGASVYRVAPLYDLNQHNQFPA